MNAYDVLGPLLALWAVGLTAFGVRRADFPRTKRQAVATAGVSVLLVAGTITAAIVTGILDEGETVGAQQPAAAAPAPSAGSLQLSAEPNALKFNRSTLQAASGPVEIVMHNPSQIDHNVSLTGNGVSQMGQIVGHGGTSTVRATLKPGKYTFYCSVPGHKQAGMVGTLTVAP